MSNRTYHPRGELVDGHPAQEHPLYQSWAGMLGRCYNKNAIGYENYGGRGITVCNRWHHFRHFAADMGQKPAPELTLERTNNSKGYAPSNCRWATHTEQCLNRRLFRNNKTGYCGVAEVTQRLRRFEARYEHSGVRYPLGRFDTADEAAATREAFVGLFKINRSAALEMVVDETLWCTSTTGVRGITPHVDGGFIVRKTVNKQRVYLGYFKTLDAAIAARENAS